MRKLFALLVLTIAVTGLSFTSASAEVSKVKSSTVLQNEHEGDEHKCEGKDCEEHAKEGEAHGDHH